MANTAAPNIVIVDDGGRSSTSLVIELTDGTSRVYVSGREDEGLARADTGRRGAETSLEDDDYALFVSHSVALAWLRRHGHGDDYTAVGLDPDWAPHGASGARFGERAGTVTRDGLAMYDVPAAHIAVELTEALSFGDRFIAVWDHAQDRQALYRVWDARSGEPISGPLPYRRAHDEADRCTTTEGATRNVFSGSQPSSNRGGVEALARWLHRRDAAEWIRGDWDADTDGLKSRYREEAAEALELVRERGSRRAAA